MLLFMLILQAMTMKLKHLIQDHPANKRERRQDSKSVLPGTVVHAVTCYLTDSHYCLTWASLVPQMVKNPSEVQETGV